MGNKKTLRYIAGACFAIAAILLIVSMVKNGFSVWSLLPLAGAVLIAASMFMSTSILTTVGSALYLVSAVKSLITYINYSSGDHHYYSKLVVLFAVMYLAIWVCLLIAGINAKSTKSMGIIAGVIAAVRFIVIVISNLVFARYLGLTFTGFLSYFVIIAGAFLIGLSAEKIEIKKEPASASNGKAPIQAKTYNTIERLTKLKSLLDSGVITQEEFESKKKQIMGCKFQVSNH
ncbi:MAG: SHOCT domain-containing protein [Lachnospiraceae bacterium]|nr:SHOCT domain-containing protein [Lachnospiraceae bacterium]MBQ6197164.1 SHOCT domain-containing protein [Lachnospiraceae bacterium]